MLMPLVRYRPEMLLLSTLLLRSYLTVFVVHHIWCVVLYFFMLIEHNMLLVFKINDLGAKLWGSSQAKTANQHLCFEHIVNQFSKIKCLNFLHIQQEEINAQKSSSRGRSSLLNLDSPSGGSQRHLAFPMTIYGTYFSRTGYIGTKNVVVIHCASQLDWILQVMSSADD